MQQRARRALRVRNAKPTDAATIHRFVTELAEYEREPNAVEAKVSDFRRQLASKRPPFECVIAELAREPVGIALFFPNYSTWRGRPGLYLEDLYVTPSARGCGVGEALLRHCAQLAVKRGYARFEWSVLDWNKPAIGFYESLGAVPMTEWTIFRVTGQALAKLGKRSARRS